MRIAVALLIAGCVSFGVLQPVRMQQPKPLTLGQVLTALRSRLASPAEKNRKLIEGVRQRGVTFKLTPEIEQSLKEEGASDELLAVMREKSRTSTDVKNSPPVTNRTVSRPRTIQNRYGIELVLIPSGSFMMGSSESEARAHFENYQQYVKDTKYEYFTNELPKHRVTIGYSFYMGRTEVTQGQWHMVMGATVREQRDRVNKSFALAGEGDNYPMYYVSWEEAKEFVSRLNALNDGYTYRLPSEAEWEYACRAGTTSDYAGDLDAMAWYADNSGGSRLNASEIWGSDQKNYVKRILENGGQTHPVGLKQANRFGLYDMAGNVWEWCEDAWHDNYNGAPTDGSAWLSGGDSTRRVLRGGSWLNFSFYLHSANRLWFAPGVRSNIIGFRVVAVPRT